MDYVSLLNSDAETEEELLCVTMPVIPLASSVARENLEVESSNRRQRTRNRRYFNEDFNN